MIRMYKEYNVIPPSNQALGRFARMMGYTKKRVMVKGTTKLWYILKNS